MCKLWKLLSRTKGKIIVFTTITASRIILSFFAPSLTSFLQYILGENAKPKTEKITCRNFLTPLPLLVLSYKKSGYKKIQKKVQFGHHVKNINAFFCLKIVCVMTSLNHMFT
jgi:hypothetical protein